MSKQEKARRGGGLTKRNLRHNYTTKSPKTMQLSLEAASQALSYVSSDDREVWYRIGMALKNEYGDSAFDVWDQWSRRSDAYKQSDAKAVWKSLSYAGKVTIGSLRYHAENGGWKPKKSSYKRVSFEERQRSEKEKKARKLKEQQAERERAKKAQEKAEELFSKSRLISFCESHNYIKNKRITPYSARVLNDFLLIEMIDINKKLRSAQLIFSKGKFSKGKKLYLKGTKKSGLFCPIGKVFSAEHIAIVEGWATGCTVHDITGLPVVVAFDSGNLMSVVEAFYNKYPAKLMTIYADNDRETEQEKGKNTGILAAEKVCNRFRGVGFLTPEFPDDAPLKLSDFNDAVCWAEGVFYEG